MPISVQHGANPSIVGMAAYMGGRNRSRNRMQDAYLGMAKEQMRNDAYLERAYMQQQGRVARGGFNMGGAQGGQIVDPMQGAKPAKQREVRAQRQANARARRMGKSAPYPNAEVSFLPPPTPQEERAQRDRADAAAAAEKEGQRQIERGEDQEAKIQAEKDRRAWVAERDQWRLDHGMGGAKDEAWNPEAPDAPWNQPGFGQPPGPRLAPAPQLPVPLSANGLLGPAIPTSPAELFQKEYQTVLASLTQQVSPSQGRAQSLPNLGGYGVDLPGSAPRDDQIGYWG